MPRPEKVQAVADIKERLEDSSAVFIAEYAGLSVQEQQELRRGLRASDSEFKVVKMTLARLAAAELGQEALSELLSGPTGLTFADADAAATAKVLRDFAKDHEALVIKGGLLEGEVLTPERVSQLADLEPRDVLLAKLAGAFQAPMAGMANLLAAMPRNMATMVKQLIDKMPPEETAVEEAAPVEEAASVEEAAESDAADETTEEAADSESADAETESPEEPAAPEASVEDVETEDSDGAASEGDADEAEEAEADEAAEPAEKAEEE